MKRTVVLPSRRYGKSEYLRKLEEYQDEQLARAHADAVMYGTGFLAVFPTGIVKRVDPDLVTVAPAAAPCTEKPE